MRRLYVFLHGVVVMSPRGNQLRLVLPSIPGHAQKAGAWLWETALAPGSVLWLQGGTAGSRSISAADPIIFLPDVTVTARRRAATI